MFEVTYGKHLDIGRLEFWIWRFPFLTEFDSFKFDGRKHLFWKFYWRT